MIGPTTIGLIRRHVYRKSKGSLITTRELLLYGKRAAVDSAVHRLVACGMLVRLARGVFARFDADLGAISVELIAQTKCGAFAKKITKHGGTAARQLALLPDNRFEKNSHYFWTNGSTSSFSALGVQIQLKKASLRKLSLEEGSGGDILKAIWFLGEHECSWHQVNIITGNLSKPQRQAVRMALPTLPAWLGDHFAKWQLPITAIMPEKPQSYSQKLWTD